MKLFYQVATPDVKISDSVTSYQGPLEKSFRDLAELGYDGVELMTLNPHALDWNAIEKEARKNNLQIGLVCTGEVFGQLGLSFVHPDESVRQEAVRRTMDIIDFASSLGADINIGRIRGQYCKELELKQTDNIAVETFKRLSEYSGRKNVRIALETVNILQTNFINTCEEAVRFINEVDNPYFRLMMDVFHLNIEEKDLYEAIRRFCSYNIHVHLADNNRRYPGHCGLDFKKIFRTFKECGYKGNFCTEIFQFPSQEAVAKESIAHLKPLLNEVFGFKS